MNKQTKNILNVEFIEDLTSNTIITKKINVSDNVQVDGNFNVDGTLTLNGTINVDDINISSGSLDVTSINTSIINNTGDIATSTINASSDILCSGDFISNRILNNPVNGANDPAYSFDSDQNTGMYRSNPDELSFSTNGTQRMSISNTQINNLVQTKCSNGTLANPGLIFDSNNGFYSGPLFLNMSVGGAMILNASSTVLNLGCPISMQNNAITNLPAPTVNTNPATKLYVDSADALCAKLGITNVFTSTNQFNSTVNFNALTALRILSLDGSKNVVTPLSAQLIPNYAGNDVPLRSSTGSLICGSLGFRTETGGTLSGLQLVNDTETNTYNLPAIGNQTSEILTSVGTQTITGNKTFDIPPSTNADATNLNQFMRMSQVLSFFKGAEISADSNVTNTTITVANTFVKAAFTSSTLDPISTSQFTMPLTNRLLYTDSAGFGYYQVICSCSFQNNGSGSNLNTMAIFLNGVIINKSRASEQSTGSGELIAVTTTFFQQLNSGDYIELWITTDSSTTMLVRDFNLSVNRIR